MKRISAFFMMFMLAVSLTACGSKEGPSGSARASEDASASEQKGSDPAETQKEETFYALNGTHNSYYDNIAASDGKDTYYVKSSEIWKLVPDGDDVLVLAKNDGAITLRNSITGGDGMLFFSSYTDGDDTMHCYDTATGTETSLGVQGGSLYYYDGWLYYRADSSVYRCRPDGSENTQILETDGGFWCLYNDWLYVMHSDGTTVRIKTDGSVEEDTGKSTRLPMIVYREQLVYNAHDLEYNTDGEYLYCWPDYGDQYGLYQCTDPDAPESGTGLTGITDRFPGEHISYVNVAGDYLIFSTGSSEEWYAATKDGTFIKELGILE